MREARNSPVKNPRLWRWLALISYFSILTLILSWIIFLAPPTKLPKSIVLAIGLIPLLPSVRGLLHARIYTHAWTCFVALPYFAFGVDASVHSTSPLLGLTLAILAFVLFFSCAFYVRFQSHHDKRTAAGLI